VDTLYRLGLAVLYDRVLGVSADQGNSAISHFKGVRIVCMPSLNIGVFTKSVVDNTYCNSTAQQVHRDPSFHKTGISLFQLFDTKNLGTYQMGVSLSMSGKKVTRLRDSYTLVPVDTAVKKELPIPEVSCLI